MRFALGVAALVVLVGCVPNQAPKITYYNWPAPVNPEDTVKAWMNANLKDPDSVKSYQWLGIHQGPSGKWFAKASFNSKNSYGGYTGIDVQLFFFDGDRISSSVSQREIDRMNGKF